MGRRGVRASLLAGLWLGFVLGLGTPSMAGQSGLPPEQVPGLPGDEDKIGERAPVGETPARPLDSTVLSLGGMFIGNIELHRQRPIPDSTPSHEEMKAVATPPEFRTPPAISFGWSWKGRR